MPNDKELYTTDELGDKAINEITQSSQKVIDFNPGSTIRAMIDSMIFFVNFLQARVKKAYTRFLVGTAEGTDLEERVADWQIIRVAATAATTTIVFIRNTPATEDFIVLADKQVSTQPDTIGNTIDFTLVENLTFTSGSTSASGVVACTQIGTIGNVAANTITNITSSIDGVDEITNPSAVINGFNAETDKQLRARVPKKILGLRRADKGSLEAAVYEVPGITFVNLKANTPDAGTNTVYVTTAIGEVSDELKGKVKVALESVQAFGIVHVIASPNIAYTTIEMSILYDDDNFTSGNVISDIKEDISLFVANNPDNFIYISDIIDIVKDISGIINVKNIKINNVADDYTVSDTEVIRLLSNNNITVNILNA